MFTGVAQVWKHGDSIHTSGIWPDATYAMQFMVSCRCGASPHNGASRLRSMDARACSVCMQPHPYRRGTAKSYSSKRGVQSLECSSAALQPRPDRPVHLPLNGLQGSSVARFSSENSTHVGVRWELSLSGPKGRGLRVGRRRIVFSSASGGAIVPGFVFS